MSEHDNVAIKYLGKQPEEVKLTEDRLLIYIAFNKLLTDLFIYRYNDASPGWTATYRSIYIPVYRRFARMDSLASCLSLGQIFKTSVILFDIIFFLETVKIRIVKTHSGAIKPET